MTPLILHDFGKKNTCPMPIQKILQKKCSFVLVERQRSFQVLTEPLLVIDLAGTVVRLIVP